MAEHVDGVCFHGGAHCRVQTFVPRRDLHVAAETTGEPQLKPGEVEERELPSSRTIDLGDQVHIAVAGRLAPSDRAREPQAADTDAPKLARILLQHGQDPRALCFTDLQVSLHFGGPAEPTSQ